jgi:hypothetical protein
MCKCMVEKSKVVTIQWILIIRKVNYSVSCIECIWNTHVNYMEAI